MSGSSLRSLDVQHTDSPTITQRAININDLPHELLLRIFDLGCERYQFSAYPHPRRRKRLPAVVRRVCIRWKHLADDPLNYRFHFAHVSLEVEENVTPSLAEQLTKFMTDLSSSNGCDLTVQLTCYAAEFDDDEPDHALAGLLATFLQGIQEIIPFQRQIASLQLCTSNSKVCRDFIRLLIRLDSTPRLSKILFRGADNLPTSLRVLMDNGSSPADYSAISLRGIHQDLSALDISQPNWLNELRFTGVIRNLYTSSSAGENDILRVFQTTPFLTDHLTVLSFSLRSDLPDAVMRSQTDRPYRLISFPSLRSLQIRGNPSPWIHYFLKYIRAPRIEAIDVSVRSPLGREEEYFEVNHLDLDHFPPLAELSLNFPRTRAGLCLFPLFKSFTAKSLKLDAVVSHSEGSGSGVGFQRVEEVLSHIRPENLELYFTTFPTEGSWRPLTTALHFRQLRTLKISSNLSQNLSERFEDPSQPWDVPPVELPLLRRVHVTIGNSFGHFAQVTGILATLRTPVLNVLSISLNSRYQDPIQLPIIPAETYLLREVTFPTVRMIHFDCDLRTSLIAVVMEVLPNWVPNASHFRVHFIGTYGWELDALSDEETPQLAHLSVDPQLDCLFTGLSPQENGDVPFPHLHLIEAGLFGKEFDGSNDLQNLRGRILSFLQLRSDKGAPSLVLKDLATQIQDPFAPDGEDLGWEITFRVMDPRTSFESKCSLGPLCSL